MKLKTNLKQRNLPNRVQQLRLNLKKNLRECADYVGVSPQAIHKFEVTGKGLVANKQFRLAEFLDCDPRLMLMPL